MSYLINNIIIIVLVYLILYIINNILNKKEHMSMQNTRLNKVLTENGFEIDANNFIIKKCENDNCLTKKYHSLHFNNLNSHLTAKNKPLSNKIFAENNIPVPKHWIINKENKNYYMNEFKLTFPCVLKPVDGMQGTDVNTFIKNKDQFIRILNTLLNKYDEIMLENQVYGDNYRIFVFNNQVIDVIKREQPFVIGNNIDNIEKLIENKNNMQKEKNLYPTKNIDWDYILEQGYNKNDIPKNNKKIFITNTINFHNGANPVRMDLNKIPIENINIFVKAHKLIKLECSGIDYMSTNIYIPYYENDGHIIEINDMVDTKIHIDADNGANPNFLFENILNTF
jgi:glutathione synthase/RimK-type ligase-like ATP-grasp enzyme